MIFAHSFDHIYSTTSQIGDETIYFADLPAEWEGHTDRMVGTVFCLQMLVL